MIGQTLGHYRIVEKLGEGGMGVVYRAQDTRLSREVAIKVLPEAFARDPERLARFRREAQLLASLNHPNIAAIYGLEEGDGLRYLVLEYVPGQTLAERIGKLAPAQGRGQGPAPTALSVEEALEICKQIAEALEAAHEKGVIHRDLKPANLKVTPEGKVKVLDFGLAKAFEPEGSDADLSKSPTISVAATRAGVILGTAAYMSPEQARGKPVDRRADIWAFGCVLYETLSGRRAFAADTGSDMLAAILTRDVDWSALPPETPPNIRRLLRRCLEKDAHRRLQHIGDARIETEEALARTPEPAPPAAAPRARPWERRILGGLLAIFASAAAWSLLRPTAPRPTLRLSMTLPPSARLDASNRPVVALSPDGSRLVYVGVAAGGRPQLYVRGIDKFEVTPIAGTEGADTPFFSPDGQSVAFFAGGKLKKVAVNGGPPVTICDAPENRGGAWGPDDTIAFTPSPASGLMRISAAGGPPRAVTTPDVKKGERGHRWPDFLPGGKPVLYTVWTGAGFGDSPMGLVSLETGEQRTLPEKGTFARYTPTGHLVFSRAGTLLAAPFDARRRKVTGPSVALLEDVATESARGTAHFSFSKDGSLVYLTGNAGLNDRRLQWVDRKGEAGMIPAPPRAYMSVRLFPDGERLAVGINDPTSTDAWAYDLARGALTRLTFEGGIFWPVLTPDGGHVVVRAERASLNLAWARADGSGGLERLTSSDNLQTAGSWSPDGKLLAFTEQDAKMGADIWLLSMEGDRKPQPFLRTPFNEAGPMFSPDGRWLAYTSDETGRFEVYVQSFPAAGQKRQISTEGGTEPVWARKGPELFYRNGDQMLAVAIQTSPAFKAGKPVLLFDKRFDKSSWYFFPNYDVAPDGRFIMIKGSDQGPTELRVVLNWFEELKRRVQTRQH